MSRIEDLYWPVRLALWPAQSVVPTRRIGVGARLNVEHQQHGMGLKGSKTKQNLKDAFAGKSQANRRCRYFANKADVEG